jgi:hypothetical protein
MRPMTFLGKMGGMSRTLNESVERQVTGQINNHKMVENGGLSLFSPQEVQPKTRSMESVGMKLRDQMNTDKQKQS